MTVTVLFPFMEDAFSDTTPVFIEFVKILNKNKDLKVLTTVDKQGRISGLLKKSGIAFEEVAFTRPVGMQDSYFKALFKLLSASLNVFFYFRAYKTDLIHFCDVQTMLSWSQPAKMNRIPYIVSIDEVKKYSHYATLALGDAEKFLCPSERIKEQLPPALRSKTELLPCAEILPQNLNAETMQKNTAAFLGELYKKLCTKQPFTKMTGLLNKN